jgi:hypothetical protein
MKIKKILILAIACLLVSGTVSVLIFKSNKDARRSFRHALSLLGDHNIKKAHQLFTQLASSFWVGKRAGLGCKITGAILKEEALDIELPGKKEGLIDGYYLPRLMERLYRTADFDTCIRLADIGRTYGSKAAELYLSAALLEKGQLDKAFEFFSGLSGEYRFSILGKRLEETFDLMHAGAQKIVRDRNGELLGTVDSDNVFNYYKPGYRQLIQPVFIRQILKNNRSRGIRLSMDLEISRLALESLGNNRGSIVLVNPETGELLAAVSDAKTAKKMGEDSSPAFEQMLEPASISKLMTTTAAFRNKLDPEKEIAGVSCGGARKYNGEYLWCPSARRRLSGFKQALAVSCNSVFADIGVKLGWEKMLEELRLYGFNSKVANPFRLGRILVTSGNDRALADLSIGLEKTEISAVHAALIATVFANGGYRVSPRLVYGTDGLTGFSPKKTGNVKKTRILNRSWLPSIRSAMRAVTRAGGTARYISPWGFPVLMKTGTGGTYRDGFHINYIGYGPENDSNIGSVAFCVRVTNKRTSHRARRAGFRTNKELLERLRDLADRRGNLF